MIPLFLDLVLDILKCHSRDQEEEIRNKRKEIKIVFKLLIFLKERP